MSIPASAMQAEGTVLDRNYRALSLFRIVFSIYLLLDFASLRRDFSDFYGAGSVLPLSALAGEKTDAIAALIRAGVVLLDAEPFPTILRVLYPLAIIAFGLGYRTRWANAAVLLLNTYFFWRNPYVVYGADVLARLMLLWCLFLPMSRYWSVDAALATTSRAQSYPALPFLAIRAQICSVYGFAALVKLSGGPWRDGYALVWTLSDNMFGTPTGLYLVQNFPHLLYYANFLVIGFQLVFALLIFSPWFNHLTRGVAIFCAALMHLSFIVCLNIGSFPFLSLAILLPLVPDAWLERLSDARWTRLENAKVYYEPGCRFCEKVSLLIREFFLAPTVAVLPASADPRALRLLDENRSWVVQGHDGTHYLKWNAMAFVLAQRRMLAPLAMLMELPIFARPFERLYDAIGRKRRALGRVTEVLLPLRAEQPMGKVALALCGLLAFLGLASNIDSIVRLSDDKGAYAPLPAAKLLLDAATVLQVSQRWYLFAPVPTHYRHTYVFKGFAAEGEPRNLMELLAAPIFRPHAGGGTVVFASHRWMKYFSYLGSLTDDEWQAFGKYMCRRLHDEGTEDAAAIRRIEITASTQPVAHMRTDPESEVQRTFDCRAMGP